MRCMVSLQLSFKMYQLQLHHLLLDRTRSDQLKQHRHVAQDVDVSMSG